MVTSATKKNRARRTQTCACHAHKRHCKTCCQARRHTRKKVSAPKKMKIVRDSFSMPQDDYALIAKLKEKALAGGLQVKKSALLRASLQVLGKSSALQLKRAILSLIPIKTGRPKKH